MEKQEFITLSIEDFQDLLIIKGKYEELSKIYYERKVEVKVNPIDLHGNIKAIPFGDPVAPYSITCEQAAENFNKKV